MTETIFTYTESETYERLRAKNIGDQWRTIIGALYELKSQIDELATAPQQPTQAKDGLKRENKNGRY